MTRLTDEPVFRHLSALDRLLPLWILAAMALGLQPGRRFPGLGADLDRVQIAGVCVHIAVGLLWVMYPVLAKVRYETIGRRASSTKLPGTSLLFDWVLGPMVVFALAWTFLSDLPAWLYADVAVLHLSMWAIAECVGIFLGAPLGAEYLIRRWLVSWRGSSGYDDVFMPRLGPPALAGLQYTIVLMFAIQGNRIVALPLDVLRIALPLVSYFVAMLAFAFAFLRDSGSDTRRRRRSRSRPPATTSNWRSPSLWSPSA